MAAEEGVTNRVACRTDRSQSRKRGGRYQLRAERLPAALLDRRYGQPGFWKAEGPVSTVMFG
jgi:hypothetical protein